MALLAKLEFAHGCDHIAFIYHHLEAGTFNKDVLDAWLRGVVAAG